MKNTSHGLGHGHFDKLSWIFYDNNNEIVQDYGSARFLNVVQKNGGHYLKENNSFAKQTIAHNTLVVNETSQFNGDWKVSQNHAPEILFFQDTKDLKITSAKFEDAYEGVIQERTIASVHIESLEFPIVIDFFQLIQIRKINTIYLFTIMGILFLKQVIFLIIRFQKFLVIQAAMNIYTKKDS
jgi:hypothetical protein